MNLVADESVDRSIVIRLRQEGHDVHYVAESAPSTTDDVLLEHANSRKCILMTADKDFGELVFRLGRVSQGVILLRLAGLSASLKAQVVSEALQMHEQEMPRAFTVISAGMVRIRHER
jgi:predicted nuclease of predicted toxin-antitoxin system